MINGLIPRRYAKALFKFAAERGNTEAVYDEMKTVINSFRENSDLCKVLGNPFVSRKDKENLLIEAAGSDVEDDYRRFVSLILDHHREEFAYLMALSYRDIYREVNHISQVKITSAANLSDAELDKIRSIVKKAFPKSLLEFSYDVDPELIGGFVIDVDSVRMDASVSNELEQLRLTLIRS